MSSVDIATETNLKKLVTVGEELLKNPVSQMNLDTGSCEPCHDATNEEALVRIARILSRERMTREARSPLGNKAKMAAFQVPK